MFNSNSLTAWTGRPRHNTAPNFEASTGTFYCALGRYSCWEAVGEVRETFISIADEIKSYLEMHSDPVPHPVTWTIYMIGGSRETAEPTIMFCCKDTSCRQRVRAAVAESRILDRYPRIRVRDDSIPPDFGHPVQLRAGNKASFQSRWLSVCERLRSAGRLVCIKVKYQYRHQRQKSRRRLPLEVSIDRQ